MTTRWDDKEKGLELTHTADDTWDFRPAFEAGYHFFIVPTNQLGSDLNWEFYYNPNFANVINKIYQDTNGQAVIIAKHNVNEHWISTSGASLSQWQDHNFEVSTTYPEQKVLLDQVKNKFVQAIIFNYSKWWLTWPIDFSKIVTGAWGSAIVIKTMEQYFNNAKAVNPRILNAYPQYWRYLIDGAGDLEHSDVGGTMYTSDWEESVDYNTLGTLNFNDTGWNFQNPVQVTWPNGEKHNWPPLSAKELSFFKAGYLINAEGMKDTVGVVLSEFTTTQLYTNMGLPMPEELPDEPPDVPPIEEPELPVGFVDAVIDISDNISKAIGKIIGVLE